MTEIELSFIGGKMKAHLDCAENDQLADRCLVEESKGSESVASPFSLPGAIVGRMLAIAPHSGPLVDFPANSSGELLPARSLVALSEAQIGSEVALLFEDGDATKPLILGVVQEWNQQGGRQSDATAGPVEVKCDHESLLLSATNEITLRCGKASITLTSAGKVLIRGAYLLSRSSGVNRIKGGSIQLN